MLSGSAGPHRHRRAESCTQISSLLCRLCSGRAFRGGKCLTRSRRIEDRAPCQCCPGGGRGRVEDTCNRL